MIDDLSMINRELPKRKYAVMFSVPGHQLNHVSFYHLLVIIFKGKDKFIKDNELVWWLRITTMFLIENQVIHFDDDYNLRYLFFIILLFQCICKIDELS